MMKKLLLVFTLLVFVNTNAAMIWGKKGHRVTGYLAEKHLNRKAKRAIDALLDGSSLAFVSTYADEIKSDCSYSKYSPWHYVNYPLGTSYVDSEKSEYGDIVMAIETCKQVLKNKKSSKSDKIFYLKMLVHLIGDLHQPLHVGRGEDKGGNDIQVRWFDNGTNLHKVWDTNMIETYGMGFYELGDELDRSTKRKERQQLQEGTIIDWLEESHTLADKVYDSAQVGEKLGYEYSYKYNDVLLQCLRKGGFRLAKVLNEVFS